MGNEIKAAPFLKWAGGKLRLIGQMRKHMPSVWLRYYVEPFLGGGALLFWMLNNRKEYFERVIANDNNPDLIGVYKTVQTDVESLIGELERLQSGIRTCRRDPCEYYLARREDYNNPKITNVVERAALFIFLNKTCFNGLYRVNKKGEFNVPFGRRSDISIYSAEILRADSKAFRGVEFTVGDYSSVRAPGFQDEAFFYFDPPYRPLNGTSRFTNYTKESFGEKEQIALAKYCQALNREGAFLMISNADTMVVNPNDDFYDKWFPRPAFHHHKVWAPRYVNSDPAGRGVISEVLITNYVPSPAKIRRGGLYCVRRACKKSLKP